MILAHHRTKRNTQSSNKYNICSASSTNDVELTPRECDIISALVAGHTHYKALSQTLQISRGTIRNHMASIFDKTGVQDRLALVLWALHNGWQLDKPCSPHNCLTNLAGHLERNV